ncbi:hypothetical protein [Kutzneria kofuensis]|uniref:hypothetical protein n=1 Tax=Kutzneria kofuensis TaxID=103725 RepID=UPI0031EB4C10
MARTPERSDSSRSLPNKVIATASPSTSATRPSTSSSRTSRARPGSPVMVIDTTHSRSSAPKPAAVKRALMSAAGVDSSASRDSSCVAARRSTTRPAASADRSKPISVASSTATSCWSAVQSATTRAQPASR